MNSKLWKKIKDWGRNYLKKPLVYYYLKSNNRQIAPENKKLNFIITDKWNEYLKTIELYQMEPVTEYKSRFDNNAKMFFLADGHNVLSVGWGISNCHNFKVNYNQSRISIGKSVINLFDFKTLEGYKRKGYYKTLLIEILNRYHDYDFLIYTAPTNIGSQRGILGAGFTEIGTYERINYRSLFNKLKTLNIDVKRGRRKRKGDKYEPEN